MNHPARDACVINTFNILGYYVYVKFTCTVINTIFQY